MGGPTGPVETSGAAQPARTIEAGNRAPAKSDVPQKAARNKVAPGIFSAQCEAWVRPAGAHSVPSSKSPQSSSFSTFAKELTQRINDGFRCIDQNNLIPSDKLPAFKACLLAEFPGNSTVAEIFDEQSEIWIIGWQAEGRTHEFWNQILTLSKVGDWQGVTQEVSSRIAALVTTSPTIEAVYWLRSILISQRFGELALPHGFKVAVDRAFDQFLEKPARAAEQVAKIYREKGAGAA